jgi:hypothetical protein
MWSQKVGGYRILFDERRTPRDITQIRLAIRGEASMMYGSVWLKKKEKEKRKEKEDVESALAVGSRGAWCAFLGYL